MAIVARYQTSNATIEIHDDSYKNLTPEETKQNWIDFSNILHYALVEQRRRENIEGGN